MRTMDAIKRTLQASGDIQCIEDALVCALDHDNFDQIRQVERLK